MLAGAAWIKNQPREITGRPWLEAGFTMNEGFHRPYIWGCPEVRSKLPVNSGSRNASVFCEDLVREVPGARSMSRRDIRPLDHWKGMAFLFFLIRMCLTSAV